MIPKGMKGAVEQKVTPGTDGIRNASRRRKRGRPHGKLLVLNIRQGEFQQTTFVICRGFPKAWDGWDIFQSGLDIPTIPQIKNFVLFALPRHHYSAR